MIFKEHSFLKDAHAFLGASKYHWINYDPEKLDRTFLLWEAAKRGTELHAFAHEAIRLKIKQRATRSTLSMYVNDAIGYRMQCEQVLFYSLNCFGTADAISFKNGKLRIHDFKSGGTRTSMNQLYIYMALFCLEYGYAPDEIEAELRIYQNDEIVIAEPDPEDIKTIMLKIVEFDKRIDQLKADRQ